jgi:adenosyl cobinamide kinase/adenosyl cobinamide phosphate guanylyltransferase
MSAPQLVLLSEAAITQTAATIAAANIASQMKSAFNQMVQAWESSRATMWSTATDPQDIADALGIYASDWFTLFDTLATWLNAYIADADALPNFVHTDYVVVPNEDGTVVISGTLDASGV